MQSGLAARSVFSVGLAPVLTGLAFPALQRPPQHDDEHSFLLQQTGCRTGLKSHQLHSIKRKVTQQ